MSYDLFISSNAYCINLSNGQVFLMNINYAEFRLILDSLKAYLDDDNVEYNQDIQSLIYKLESNEN